MTNHERPDSHQEPPKPTGPSGAVARYLSRLLSGRGRTPPSPADALAPMLARSERTDLDMHKERVAAKVAALFNMVDARVGGWIGYPGNIREELQGRLVTTARYQHRVNTEGMDPSLQAYLRNDIFFFRLDDEKGVPEAMYTIDCQVGRFIPSIHVATHDGFVKATLSMGANRDEFHNVHIRRVFGDGQVNHLTTFTSNFMNPYDPPHPLLIEKGGLPMPHSHMIYDNIDPDGNVSLLDGQMIRAPSGRVTGRYSAADHTISPITGVRFPYAVRDGQLLIGDPYKQVGFPLQTNIYSELASMTQNLRGIST